MGKWDECAIAVTVFNICKVNSACKSVMWNYLTGKRKSPLHQQAYQPARNSYKAFIRIRYTDGRLVKFVKWKRQWKMDWNIVEIPERVVMAYRRNTPPKKRSMSHLVLLKTNQQNIKHKKKRHKRILTAEWTPAIIATKMTTSSVE